MNQQTKSERTAYLCIKGIDRMDDPADLHKLTVCVEDLMEKHDEALHEDDTPQALAALTGTQLGRLLHDHHEIGEAILDIEHEKWQRPNASKPDRFANCGFSNDPNSKIRLKS